MRRSTTHTALHTVGVPSPVMPLTNAQARRQYPETIVSYSPLQCNYGGLPRVSFLAGAGQYANQPRVSLAVHPSTEEAFETLAFLFEYFGYRFREKAGGTLACRTITGGTLSSLHAHGIALDINPSANPYGPGDDELDLPKWSKMLAAILAVRTVDGLPVWVWGGMWNNDDDMHWQPTACSRSQLERGIDWSTVFGYGAMMKDYYPLELGDGIGDLGTPGLRGKVAEFQNLLNDARPLWAEPGSAVATDGQYGDLTADAVVKCLGLSGSGGADDRGESVGGNQYARVRRLATQALAAAQNPIGHTHPEYAASGHSHAPTAHIHSQYAEKTHGHDYAPSLHGHEPQPPAPHHHLDDPVPDHEHDVTGTAR